jgi:hypothetical protein
MAARKQWSDLSPRTRRLLSVAAFIEGILKLVALIEISSGGQPARSEGPSGCGPRR